MDIENLFNNISRMDLLRTFGLAPRPRDYILPALGLFSTGVLIGAGVTLLFAPKSGRRLRKDLSEDLRSRLEDLGDGFDRIRRDFMSKVEGDDDDQDEESEPSEGEQGGYRQRGESGQEQEEYQQSGGYGQSSSEGGYQQGGYGQQSSEGEQAA
jgi:gas vesicle protein